MKIRQVKIGSSRFKLSTLIAELVVTGALIAAGSWYLNESRNMVRREFDVTALGSEIQPVLDEIEKINSTSAMDAWIQSREADVARNLAAGGATIKLNQRKGVVWFGRDADVKLRTPISIVYVHGFSASRLELDPVVEQVAKNLEANVFYTRLKAHGLSDGEAFAKVRARDWAKDVEEAIAIGKKIGERVVVISMSTGSSLVLENLVRHADDATGGSVAAAVLLSPNYGVRAWGSSLLLGPLAAPIAHLVIGTHREFKTENAMHADRWTARYRVEGLVAMSTAVAETKDLALAKIKAPVLTIYTSKDDVVDVAEIERRSKEFTATGSKLVNWELGKRHELASATFDADHASDLARLISEWLKMDLARRLK